MEGQNPREATIIPNGGAARTSPEATMSEFHRTREETERNLDKALEFAGRLRNAVTDLESNLLAMKAVLGRARTVR